MGYVHNTDICKFIPPSFFMFSSGTWAPAISSNVVTYNRTAAAAEFFIYIPLSPLPGSEGALTGAKIQSVDVWYEINTAALTASDSVTISKVALNANGDALTGTAPDVTIDADNDTSNERKTVDDHKMTVTLDTEVFVEDDVAYYLVIHMNAAAGSVVKLSGAQVNYDLRL